MTVTSYQGGSYTLVSQQLIRDASKDYTGYFLFVGQQTLEDEVKKIHEEDRRRSGGRGPGGARAYRGGMWEREWDGLDMPPMGGSAPGLPGEGSLLGQP